MSRRFSLTTYDRKLLAVFHVAADTPHRTSDPVSLKSVSQEIDRVGREAEQYAQKEVLELRVLALKQELERANAETRYWRDRYEWERVGALFLFLGLAVAAAAQWWAGR